MDTKRMMTAEDMAALMRLKANPAHEEEMARLMDFALEMKPCGEHPWQEEPPMPLGEDMVMPSLDRETLLQQAPDREGEYIRLPNALGAVT